jgi:catechol 2,3-dioxygenase-like lactoylglutathione lyase family enzyme
MEPLAPEDPRMTLFKAFNHVSITVTDLAKAKEFYGGLLGFKEIPRPAFNFPGVWYGIGGDLSLHIIVNEALVRPPVERASFEGRYSSCGRTTATRRPSSSPPPASTSMTSCPRPPGSASSS